MADVLYQRGVKEVVGAGWITPSGGNYYVLLVGHDAPVGFDDPDNSTIQDVIGTGGNHSGTAAANEHSAGAREPLAGMSITIVDTDGSEGLQFKATNPTFTALPADAGGAAKGFLLYFRPTGGTDSLCVPIVLFDTADILSNGGDVICNFGSNGCFTASV